MMPSLQKLGIILEKVEARKNATTIYEKWSPISIGIFLAKFVAVSKGQIKPKADWRAVDSPKK